MKSPVEIMLQEHLKARGIMDELVLAAMRSVPRESFVPPDQQQYAYDDRPLPIGSGQTISQPYIVALMLQLAQLSPDSVVLDVGTGSGYMAAVAAQIARRVCTMECFSELTETAVRRFDSLGIANIDARIGDGSRGWPEQEVFDAILVSCVTDEAPHALIDQLKPGGRMVLPLSHDPHSQVLTTYHKTLAGPVEITEHLSVRFVPML